MATKTKPRTKAVLPPRSSVFGAGGEGSTATDERRAPKITRAIQAVPKTQSVRGGLTKAPIPKVRPSSGKNKARTDATAPQKQSEFAQGRLVDCPRATETGIDSTCQKLRELQRRKVAALKARIAIDNQLTALVAIELGYSAGLEEKDRKRLWTEAKSAIKAMTGRADDYQLHAESQRVRSVVIATQQASDGFDEYLVRVEKEMVALAKTLPISKWAEQQRGFGMLSLAAIVGECGNIGHYSGPAALQKRLGLAPIQHQGETRMPSTWRSSGGLPAETWVEAGYSPRRRSLMFVIGECLVKMNKGEFRARYDEARDAAKTTHPDWTDGHSHNHGMLLATKRLVKRLWQQWRGQEGDMPPRLIVPAKKGNAAGKAIVNVTPSGVAPSQKHRQPRAELPPARLQAANGADSAEPTGKHPAPRSKAKANAALPTTTATPSRLQARAAIDPQEAAKRVQVPGVMLPNKQKEAPLVVRPVMSQRKTIRAATINK